MRIVAQRVLEASVTVDGQIVGKIGRGLLVLVGFTKGDDKDTLENMVSKTINMRLWETEGKAWAASVKDIGGEILVVSQFTLYGTLKKGNKPDFHAALTANDAKTMYEKYVEMLRDKMGKQRVQTGQFQARMVVNSANDGPVTLIHEKNPQGLKQPEKQQSKETTQ